MKPVLKKFISCLLLLPLAMLLLLSSQPAIAQTDPEATAYPPPVTPVQPDEGYPLNRPTIIAPENDEGYIAPTQPPTATPAALGQDAVGLEATRASIIPISQSTLVRNRLILWAGFLVTLLIFGLAVYGAMLMYTRPRS